jgi:CelD/BcsL family acetyltransferase involved in cellulose biosynthesis
MVAAVTSVFVAQRVEELDPVVAEWDSLAEQDGGPFARPGWLLSWWRAAQLQEDFGGELRVVVVFDERGLAGVAPLFIENGQARVVHLHFIGHEAWWGVHPLVRNDGAEETMDVVAGAIASLRPRVSILSFDAVDVQSAWPHALVQRWPGRGPWLRTSQYARATAVRLDGTFDEWVWARGHDWRGEFARRNRRFSELGGIVRRAESAPDVRRSLAELVRLQHARWTSPSDQLSPVIIQTLQGAGEGLAASNGFRLWIVEVDGEVIGATAFAAAGGAVAVLVTAFDPRWARFAPGQRSMVAGIEEGFRLGDEVVDLGFGEFPYKFRLANEVRWVAWYEVFPRERGYARARSHALPRHARETLNHGRVRLRARSRLAEARERAPRKPTGSERS